MGISRRQFLRTCACTSLYLALFPASAQWPSPGAGARNVEPPPPVDEDIRTRRHTLVHGPLDSVGCALSAAGMASLSDGRFRLLNTSGDPQFDQLMTVEAQLLSQAMSIRPGVFFLDDRGGPNAYATTHSFQQGTRGTVMFGVELAHNEMYSGGLSGNALIGILAHEHGHIAYFESGLDRHNPLMELHADFMAGWWLGMKAVAGHPLVDLRSLARSLFEKGDFSFNSPHHHGTPQQRVAAMQGGAEAAMRGAHSARSAFSAGHSFLR